MKEAHPKMCPHLGNLFNYNAFPLLEVVVNTELEVTTIKTDVEIVTLRTIGNL